MFEDDRARLVEALISEGVLKCARVIGALRKVERHMFVPPNIRVNSYVDYPQSIGFSQTISAPHMVAIMSELLDVKDDSRILEIGTGSGYQAAVLSELAPRGMVVTVERIPELGQLAKCVFKDLGYGNITVVVGDGTLGLPEYAPYDRIIVTAAAPKIPDALVGELAFGGRLLIPVGGKWSQTLMRVEKDGDGEVSVAAHGGCVFVPLIGVDGW